MDIPERWATAIRSAGFGSISALANEASVSTNRVVAIVSGAAAPDGASKRSLARAMGLSPEELAELVGTVCEEKPDPFILPEGSERLTPRQRAVVTEMILTFLEGNGASAEPRSREA